MANDNWICIQYQAQLCVKEIVTAKCPAFRASRVALDIAVESDAKNYPTVGVANSLAGGNDGSDTTLAHSDLNS